MKELYLFGYDNDARVYSYGKGYGKGQRFIFIFILIIFIISSVSSQGLPHTSITAFDYNQNSDNILSNPQYLTEFNAKGYNNQPSFFSNDILYITSDWKAKGQTDIVKLNLKSKSLLKVTDTDESEYSPTAAPDNITFSCISVPPGQKGDNPVQLLWKYPLSRSDMGEAVSYDFENVGYHHWINRIEVALFLVDDPHELIIYNTINGTVTEVDKNIGRCFKLNNKGILIYVHKAAHNIWYLKTYNTISNQKNIIGETKTGSEDFIVLSNGNIIMGQGSKLYMLGAIGAWKEIADLNIYGINNITRLAIKSNKLAIVHAP
ncbi:MAG: hypothetical protein V3V00_13990 [Saprospiraceae bacterium]